MLTRIVDTAAGPVLVEATAEGVARLESVAPGTVVSGTGRGGDDDEGRDPDPPAAAGRAEPAARHIDRLAAQLDAYCAGRLREFDVPVDWAAAGVHDAFAREVYREIRAVPYGETATYGQISVDAGRPRNARRVGRLCSLVPVSFVIPVHRVIRADGGLGRCPELRRRLLDHERRNTSSSSPVALPPA